MFQRKEKSSEIQLPIISLRGLVVFPSLMLEFEVAREKSVIALKDAMNRNQDIFLVSQKDIREEDPKPEQLNSVGVIANILQVIQHPGGPIRVLVKGTRRGKIKQIISEKPFLLGNIELVDEDKSNKDHSYNEAIIRQAKDVFNKYVSIISGIPADMILTVQSCDDAGELADYIASNMLVDYESKQIVLSEIDPNVRLEKLTKLLVEEINIISIEDDLNNKLNIRIDKGQKEYYLREQMKLISEELGDATDPTNESNMLIEKIKALNLPEDISKPLIDECNRLSSMPQGSSEANVSRNYIDTCISLPWNTYTEDIIDIDRAKEILDKHHYGLDKVKERIIESLAVRKLAPNIKGQIICLIGPPGVGKTSIVKSIAESMGRKYARISLGGVRDEADIRGHRRTYIGAMPGRIISAIKYAGSKNPIILLDEVDKLGKDYHGDPTSALLELLDSEQNNKFHDHYIDVPFDLSDVIFITTANSEESIPDPLIDRMDKIILTSYTREEKFNIAKKHLIPKQLERHGLDGKLVKFTDSAIRHIIDDYTSEAGVRGLERVIASIFRKCAKNFVAGEIDKAIIDVTKLEEYLGPKKYKRDKISKKDEVGVANGLAWTSVGGETLPIEVTFMRGTGKVKLTGSLGDVMKESAEIAISCVRRYSIDFKVEQDFYTKNDIHIHVPEGATPKDGPSAGIAIAISIISALTNIPVKRDIAMTGEITLRGRVLPIGGLKEKTMGAYRAGIKKVIIPFDNKADLSEIDETVKDAMQFSFVDNFHDAVKLALTKPIEYKKVRKKDEDDLGEDVTVIQPIYI